MSSSIKGEVSGDLSGNGSRQEEPRPLTVLQVVPMMDSGGVERGTLEITEAITREGGRAIVATAGGKLLPRITKAGGEVIAMNVDTKNPLNIWQNARLFARLIRDLGIDIVHARSRAPAWSAYWATQRTGTHFITTYHGTYNEDFPFKRRYNAVMAKGQPVIAVSNFIRNLIIERHNLSAGKIVTIPRGADINVFSEETVGNERAVKLADRWGLLDDPRPVIMLPARLTRWKGAEDMIDAAVRLRSMRGNDFLILLVGEDSSRGFVLVARRQRMDRLGAARSSGRIDSQDARGAGQRALLGDRQRGLPVSRLTGHADAGEAHKVEKLEGVRRATRERRALLLRLPRQPPIDD